MAKPKTPNQNKKYKALDMRLRKYISRVRSIYDALALEVSKIAVSVQYNTEEKDKFNFSDFPSTNDRIKKWQQSFVTDMKGVIYSGINAEWKNSNMVQDLLANDVLKAYGIKRGKEKHKVLYQTNNEAKRAFLNRVDNGMSI